MEKIIFSNKKLLIFDNFNDGKSLSIINKKNNSISTIVLDSSLECTWELQRILSNTKDKTGRRWIFRYCLMNSDIIKKYFCKSGNLDIKLRNKDWNNLCLQS